MELPPPDILAYALRHSTPEDELLREVEAYTRAHHSHAHMLSGPLQGRLLAAFSRMAAPSRILEIGTYTGYGALCLAEGLNDEGILHTIELREEDARIAAGFFARSRHADRIRIHTGDAHLLLPEFREPWDLVFIDADKTGYIRYYESVLPAVRPGGWIIADNVLFHGQVLEQPVRSRNAAAIEGFNRHVAADPRVECLLLPVRDGLMLIRKKAEIA